MKTPYLEAPDRQSDFVQSLLHALLANGAQPMQDKAHASVVVSILRDNVTRRVLSVSALNQPNEYEVTYTVSFSVTAGDKELLPAQELSATRTYSFDERLLLAKEHEEDDPARGHGARSRRYGHAAAVEPLAQAHVPDAHGAAGTPSIARRCVALLGRYGLTLTPGCARPNPSPAPTGARARPGLQGSRLLPAPTRRCTPCCTKPLTSSA